jgi:hypothetical protein
MKETEHQRPATFKKMIKFMFVLQASYHVYKIESLFLFETLVQVNLLAFGLRFLATALGGIGLSKIGQGLG